MDTRRARGVAALIEGVFAAMWFSWGQADPPSWLSLLLVLGAVLALVVAIAAVVTVVRAHGQHTPMQDPDIRRRYLLVVRVEVGALVAGAVVLAVVGLSDWIPVWVCAGVGLHFFPLHQVLRGPLMIPLGAVLTAVALVALVVGLASSTAPATITGAGAGLALLLSGALTLVNHRGYQSADTA